MKHTLIIIALGALPAVGIWLRMNGNC